MESPIANPPRNLLWQKVLLYWNANAVLKSPPLPLEDHRPEILPEGFFVSGPHQDRWMVLPSGGSPGQDIQDLHSFHTLFSETLVV
ncbi:MAG TPA: hypothetical protein VEI49_10515 [Terriglobales bacterium]|nr:hypothetical protein [Terriglobales bacterium]